MARHAEIGDAGGGPTPGSDPPRRAPGTGPKHAVSAPAGRRSVVALVAIVGIVAIAVVVFQQNSGAQDLAAPQAPPTAADSRASAPSEPSATTTNGEKTTSVQSAPSIRGGSVTAPLGDRLTAAVPENGPGLTEPGILLIASPSSDGSFDVIERIRLASPVSLLQLRPAPVDRVGRQFASASAAAAEVQVRAGDQPVVVPGAKINAEIGLPVTNADQFELRYRLRDITIRSTPSTDGRALAAIGPLTTGVDDDLPVLFIVSGGTVLGLSCPLLPLSEQSCGSTIPTGSGIGHELPWRLALTSVQFNLPPA